MEYTQTPDMYRDNTSTQTQPIQHFEAGTNTNLGSNKSSHGHLSSRLLISPWFGVFVNCVLTVLWCVCENQLLAKF